MTPFSHWTSVCLAMCCAPLVFAHTAPAQTLDVVTLGNDVVVAVELDSETGGQKLVANGEVLLAAPEIVSDLAIADTSGEPSALVVFVDQDTPGCPPAPYIVSVQFGQAWLEGPIGQVCAPYLVTVRPGTASLVSPPDLGEFGNAMVYSLTEGLVTLGTIAYTPQIGRGWDALDAEFGGYSDLSTLDLYAAEPVFNALNSLWGGDLFIYARHLSTRTIPVLEGNFLMQSGCLTGQCAFTLGLLLVDPTREEVYSALFNEGAPDVRPPLETWSEPARGLFERWREGDFR